MSAYTSTLSELYALNRLRGIDLGLERCEELHRLMGAPSEEYPTIHVAGTNGKGSVAYKLSKALEGAGYRVGIFTSPHIASFRERIQVNSQLISEEAVVEGVLAIRRLADQASIPITFFEICTLLALQYFNEQKVDCAVIEVGLGGRLDATNIISPILSIITSIGKDHTQYLGETLESIAHEKAGIIKPGVPVLIGPSVPSHVVEEYCGKSYRQLSHSFEDKEEENSVLAEEAFSLLLPHFPQLSECSYKRTVREERPPCRFQEVQLEGFPPLVVDVAHNAPALSHLFAKVKKRYTGRPIFVLCALSLDKEIDNCLKILQSYAKHVSFIEAPNGRSCPAKQLQKKLPEMSTSHSHLTAGLSEAKERGLAEEGVLIICGSFFILEPLAFHLDLGLSPDPI